MKTVLQVKDLKIEFHTYAGVVQAVNNISFDLREGEVIGLVGESGCGKSVTSGSIMRLIPMPPGKYANGQILFENKDIVKMGEAELRDLRGNKIAMIFQDPMTCLNPVLTVGRQLMETYILHQGMNNRQASEKAIEMLRRVGIPAPEQRVKQYPHELSGGMRQRVMIAMALGCNPKVLIADEPTTALDVTIQAQIMDLIKTLNSELNTAVILITHDLGVVAGMCDRVLVMYAGHIVESANVKDLYANPRHPYTWSLLQSIPRMDQAKHKLQTIAGKPPDLLNPPSGCGFMPRCKFAMDLCNKKPPLFTVSDSHQAACWMLHPECPHDLKQLFAEEVAK
ncbi:MAG: ABC transporter ATP-binding protein [Bacillota bacterium]